MLRPFLIALFAASGNALFIYGQRSAAASPNPFLYLACSIGFGCVLVVAAMFAWQTPGNAAYAMGNLLYIVLGGVGLFVTYLGFYLLFSNYGASQYALYATLAILTTSFGVGVLVFKEPLHPIQYVAIALAVLAIGLWSYGRSLVAAA
jgi:drug/metabolite transporter (DMT)-like permease